MLATLPQLWRAAQVLHSQEELTYEEIAARLGVTRHKCCAKAAGLLRDSQVIEHVCWPSKIPHNDN
jgi:DNA-directed RNA polymerase specialized sigma24 family protein